MNRIALGLLVMAAGGLFTPLVAQTPPGGKDAPGAAASAGAEDSAGGAVRVTSFNIRYLNNTDGENVWPLRRELALATLRSADADLVGLQEVVHAQAEEIRAALREYEFVGAGRADGKTQGEYSPILFRRDRFEKLDEGHVWLSPTPEVPGSKGWDAAFPRMATWARLRDRRAPGRELLFVNTHWDHKGAIARGESAKMLRALLIERAKGAGVIVTGDFNCREGDEPYGTLVGPADDAPLRLIDSYRAVHALRGPDEATFHAFKGRRTGARIDFILHTPHWRAIEASIDLTSEAGRFPSDHYPVHAVLKNDRADDGN